MKRQERRKSKAQSETDYLLASPANAKRLRRSIRALETGKGLIRPKLLWLSACLSKPKLSQTNGSNSNETTRAPQIEGAVRN